MSEKRKRRRAVALAQLEDLGPVHVKTTINRETLRQIAETQAAFGGAPRARLTIESYEGRRRVLVAVRYTSTRVTIGPLDEESARAVSAQVRWLALRGREPGCEAWIDSDPESPDYLDVWLNISRDPREEWPDRLSATVD